MNSEKSDTQAQAPDKLPDGLMAPQGEKPRSPVARDLGLEPRTGETYTIKGGSSVIWGVAGTSALGTVLTHDVDDSAQFEKIESQTGAVTGIVIYDTETVVKLSIVALSTATRPAIGDTLTIGGISGTVLKSSLKATNKSTAKFEVEANKWANLSLGA